MGLALMAGWLGLIADVLVLFSRVGLTSKKKKGCISKYRKGLRSSVVVVEGVEWNQAGSYGILKGVAHVNDISRFQEKWS